VKDSTFLKLLRELQDSLPKDNLPDQLVALTSALASSIKQYSISASAASPVQHGNSIQSFLKVGVASWERGQHSKKNK
jgi:hypothetical protein